MATTCSHPFAMSSSALATSMKFKTLIHNFILSQLCRLARALTKAKSILIELFKETHFSGINFLEPLILKKNRSKNKVYVGSFRLHYNWCSSHVVPMASHAIHGGFTDHVYYDSTWNSFVDPEVVQESELSGYLHWLEEKNKDDQGVDDINEIDQLADKFIANCHEKFRLEKQESYRRFQEMMGRSV